MIRKREIGIDGRLSRERTCRLTVLFRVRRATSGIPLSVTALASVILLRLDVLAVHYREATETAALIVGCLSESLTTSTSNVHF